MKEWLWRKGPHRLWARKCTDVECQFPTVNSIRAQDATHYGHLSKLGMWVLGIPKTRKLS